MGQTVQPEQFSRRSFVYRRLQAAGCTWRARERTAVAATVPHPAAPPDDRVGRVGGVGLADLSPLTRWGVKGTGALDWLRAASWPVPDINNRAGRQRDGALVVRLGDGEALLLEATTAPSPALRKLMADALPPRCYAVPREDSHLWFRLVGAQGPECLAKVCGVDFRLHRFADLSVAQTSLARLSAIIVRDDDRAGAAFHILADSASALYLWDCLIDAMAEFSGRLFGLDDLARR